MGCIHISGMGLMMLYSLLAPINTCYQVRVTKLQRLGVAAYPCMPNLSSILPNQTARTEGGSSQLVPSTLHQLPLLASQEGCWSYIELQVQLTLQNSFAGSRDASQTGSAGLLQDHMGRATDKMGYKCNMPLELWDCISWLILLIQTYPIVKDKYRW